MNEIEKQLNLLNEIRQDNIKENNKLKIIKKNSKSFMKYQNKYFKEYSKMLKLLENIPFIEILGQKIYKIGDTVFFFYSSKFKTLLCKLDKTKIKENVIIKEEELKLPEKLEDYEENRTLLLFPFEGKKSKLINIPQSKYEEIKPFLN